MEKKRLLEIYLAGRGRSILIDKSLSRVWKFAQGNGFLIISAFRQDKPKEENIARQNELKKDLREADLVFFEMYGRWEKQETGKIGEELSLFIPYNPKSELMGDEFYSFAIDLMKKYNQDAIVFQGIGKKEVSVLDDNGNEVFYTDSFNADKILEVYSVSKYGNYAGRSFIFMGVKVPSGFAHARLMKEQGYIL